MSGRVSVPGGESPPGTRAPATRTLSGGSGGPAVTPRRAIGRVRRAEARWERARAERVEAITSAVLDAGVPMKELARETGVDVKQIHRFVTTERERR